MADEEFRESKEPRSTEREHAPTNITKTAHKRKHGPYNRQDQRRGFALGEGTLQHYNADRLWAPNHPDWAAEKTWHEPTASPMAELHQEFRLNKQAKRRLLEWDDARDPRAANPYTGLLVAREQVLGEVTRAFNRVGADLTPGHQ